MRKRRAGGALDCEKTSPATYKMLMAIAGLNSGPEQCNSLAEPSWKLEVSGLGFLGLVGFMGSIELLSGLGAFSI